MVVLVFNNDDRNKLNNHNDELFYLNPRLVFHLDKSFRDRLRRLYSETIKENSIILDLMSSWVSHLPDDKKFKRVIGHGLNREELAANSKLDRFWCQNLNEIYKIPLEDNSIDVCLVVAGWQYLQNPENIASEIYRVCKNSGKIIISFSNRAFWEKTPKIWSTTNQLDNIDSIKKVLKAQGWINLTHIQEENRVNGFAAILNINNDPFYAVIGNK